MTEARIRAHHEAGHAVVCHVLESGLPEYVLAGGVVDDEDGDASAGHFRFGLDGADHDPGAAARAACVLFAGYEAERRLTGDDENALSGARSDFAQANWLLDCAVDPDQVAEVHSQARVRSAGLVAQHWAAICVVAAELLARRRLSAQDVEWLRGIADQDAVCQALYRQEHGRTVETG